MGTFQTFPNRNIAQGLDNRSAYNTIRDGYAETIRNLDTNSTGYISKRKGYQGYHGYLPLRVSTFTDNGDDTATIEFDSQVNFITSTVSPIVLYGRLWRVGTGTLTSSGTAVTGTGTSFLTQLEVGSLIQADGETRRVTAIASDTSLTVAYTFSSNLSGDSFTHYTAAEYYWETYVNNTRKTLASGQASITKTITNTAASEDVLAGVVKMSNSSDYDNTEIWPEEIKVDSSQIDFTFDTSQEPSSIDVIPFVEDSTIDGMSKYSKTDCQITAAEIAGGGGTNTYSITAATHGLPNMNLVVGIYYYDDTNSKYKRMFPEELKIDSVGDITITFEGLDESDNEYLDDATGDFNFMIVVYDMPSEYHQEQSFTAGEHTVSFTGITNFINHTSIFLHSGSNDLLVLPEIVTYDDSAETLTFTVNLVTSGVLKFNYLPGVAISNDINVTIESDDWVNSTDPEACIYGIPHSNITYDSVVAPKGGHIQNLSEYSSQGVNKLIAGLGGVLFEENSTDGDPLTLASYYVDIRDRTDESKTIGPFFGASATMRSSYRGVDADNITSNKAIISTITNNGDGTATFALDIDAGSKVGTLADLTTNDKITVTNVSTDWYEGTFYITSVDDSADTITATVPNLPSFVSNETDVDGHLAIYTNQVKMVSSSLPHLVDDIINSSLFSGFSPTVLSTSGTSLYLTGVTSETLIPSAAQFSSTRTTDTIPLTSTDYMVVGDMVNVSDYSRKFQITAIDTTNDTITIDESITIQDVASAEATYVAVSGRWVAIESPIMNEIKFNYLDENEYTNQNRCKSAIINDSIFVSDYANDIMKYDGANFYRAGLPSWRPITHSWVDTGTAGIPVPKFSYLSTTNATNKIQFAAVADIPDIVADEPIYLYENGTISAGYYDVTEVDLDAMTITVSQTLGTGDEGRGKLSVQQEISYYFKLQAIDRNGNLIASAVTNPTDCVINMTQSGKIIHRLTGMPKFDIYDYDRIDLMVYRTKVSSSAVAPFYEIRRFPIDFETANALNSIIITASTPDSSFPSTPDDQVSIKLKGAELPYSSDAPARAKYIESVGNRLILSNIKSYNTLDITLVSEDEDQTINDTMDDCIVSLTDGTTTYEFEFFNPIKNTGAYPRDIDTTNCRQVTDIDFTTSADYFELTLDGTVGSGNSLTGKWIQIESFLTENPGSGLRDESTATSIDGDNGKICGWWKVDSHTINDPGNDTVKIKHIHGISADWTVAGTDAMMYMGFNVISSKIPIFAFPVFDDWTDETVVTKLTYKDTKNSIEGTSAIIRGMIDLKDAINRVMVEDSAPWALAKAGSTEGSGRIKIEAVHPSKTLSITITKDTDSDLEIFVNQLKVESGTAADGVTSVFPSRLLISAEKYPEIFDNPYASHSIYSDSIVDVNSDDGEEIIGTSSFFAIASSTNTQVEETLLVFKNRSIYAVNIVTREQKKLESMGQGCTIPGSIAAAQDGVIFANQSGIYKVTRGLTVEYVGRWVENYWKDDVSSTYVENEAIGFADSLNRKYKLSVPTDSKTNDEVIVFDYIIEQGGEGTGAWTIYDNINASYWCQTNSNTFFSNYSGRIFSIRNIGDETDYRDDASGITSIFTYGAKDFGDSGLRKNIGRIISHLKTETDITNVTLEAATDMSQTFSSVGTLSALSSEKKLHSIASSVPERHCLYIQVRYTHSTKDENFILTAIDFKVLGLEELGITQDTE